MSDTGEVFKAMREASQEKRAFNRLRSADLLRSRGVEFKTSNYGSHLLVSHEGRVIDFWPGTGLWIDRSHPFSAIKGRGVRRLLAHMGKEKG